MQADREPEWLTELRALRHELEERANQRHARLSALERRREAAEDREDRPTLTLIQGGLEDA